MAEPVPDRFEACRHLLWQIAPVTEEVTPGPYCRNELGVFSALDCPEFQGRPCRCFEERGVEPTGATAEDIREHLVELSGDYLSWRYWRRVAGLNPEPEAPSPPDPE